ncbi:MAG: hypothetical protein JNL60_05380 [Bacteroidia bacterium]|nr:hypothetical protein [Bacteroidia bacterium]
MLRLNIILLMLVSGLGKSQFPLGVQLTADNPAPTIVMAKFNETYPDISPIWWRSGDHYSATFIEAPSGIKRIMVYDSFGNLVRNDSQVGEKVYPAPIKQYCNKKYPGEKYDIWSSEDSKGKKSYFLSRGREIVWFDEQGNYRTKPGDNNSKSKSNIQFN